mmetsp:Transcript_7886/g.25100  ORF Transcript_7886/g.25100 Transcript_7886/m.25100 type:complete len:271 (+) Transcript_7886:458-1270(+)
MEGCVVLAEEGHAEDPERAPVGGRVGLHDGKLAVAVPGLQGPQPRESSHLSGHGADLREVRVGRQGEGVPAQVEGDVGEIPHVGAVCLEVVQGFLELRNHICGHHQQGGTAVDDGAATTVTADTDGLLGGDGPGRQPHPSHAHGPRVPAQDGNPPEEVGHTVSAVIAPNEVARAAWSAHEADGEHGDVEVREHCRLDADLIGKVRFVLDLHELPEFGIPATRQGAGEVLHGGQRLLPCLGRGHLRRAHADDGLEVRLLKHRHEGLVCLPE